MEALYHKVSFLGIGGSCQFTPSMKFVEYPSLLLRIAVIIWMKLLTSNLPQYF